MVFTGTLFGNTFAWVETHTPFENTHAVRQDINVKVSAFMVIDGNVLTLDNSDYELGRYMKMVEWDKRDDFKLPVLPGDYSEMWLTGK